MLSGVFRGTWDTMYKGNMKKKKKNFIIPPVYEVYRGYIVFAFPCVCVFVNFFFRQRFLRNYLT